MTNNVHCAHHELRKIMRGWISCGFAKNVCPWPDLKSVPKEKFYYLKQ